MARKHKKHKWTHWYRRPFTVVDFRICKICGKWQNYIHSGKFANFRIHLYDEMAREAKGITDNPIEDIRRAIKRIRQKDSHAR